MKLNKNIILWILVGLLSLGQLQRIELPKYTISFYLHDIFIILFVFHTVFTNPIALYNNIHIFFKKEKIIQLFTGVTILSLILNFIINPDYIVLLYSFRLLTYILFGFSIALLIKNKIIDAEYLKFQIFSVGLFSLLLGFLQFIFIPDTRFLSVLGWDDHYARLISTYFDPGFTGIIFLFTLFVGLSSNYIKNKYIQLLLIFSFSWGIILTFSRASYLALLIGLLLIAVHKIKLNTTLLKIGILGSLSIVFLIIIAPKPYGEGVNLLRTASIYARTNAIKEQLTTLSAQTIVIGNGLFSKKNSLSSITETQTNNLIPSHSRLPDNIFVTVLLSTGVFGLFLFILILNKWIQQLRSRNIFIAIGFICILIHSQFSNSLLQPFVLLLLLLAATTETNYKLKK